MSAVLALMLFVAPKAWGEYIYTIVAETTTVTPVGRLSSFNNDPAISNGTVAFRGFYDGGASKAIFTGSGGPLTTIVKTGDAAPQGTFTDFGLRGPAISGGTTVFKGSYTSGQNAYQGIFTGSGAAKTTIAKTGDSAPNGTFSTFDDPAISNGTVAFNASYTGGEGVFNSTGGIVTTIATSNGEAPARVFTSMFSPAISNGTTAFFGGFSGNDGFGQGIFADSGAGPTIEIVKNGDAAPPGTIVGGFDNPAIGGTITAFHASYNDGSFNKPGIFRSDGSGTTTIAKYGDAAASGVFQSFDLSPAISGGTTAFVGINNGGSAGIYVGSGGVLTNVIKAGDSPFGSPIIELRIGTFGLDADGSGRIAFYYSLMNGRRGIAMATPVIAGDFNHNGSVGPEDFDLWKSTFGSTTNLNADGNGNHIVDGADYVVWRKHLGSSGIGTQMSSNPAGGGVPEPGAESLLIYAFLAIIFKHRKCRGLGN
jgi:hypothetical protein